MRRFYGACGLGLWAAVALSAGCEGSDPTTTPTSSTTSSTGTGGTVGTGGLGGAGGGGAPQDPCAGYDEVESATSAGCTPLATDYQPRDQASANDPWAACISDDGQYHPFDASISSVARVAAFEQIAALLSFGTTTAPSAQAFLDARVAYSVDQGLESRVSRREDEHYPPAPKQCRDLTADEQKQYPDRCEGPVKMAPILNQAFQDGIDGKEPALAAARIEATLLWFLYSSVYKESRTCAATAVDCDSSWAYYTGGEGRSGGLGLSRYLQARSQDTHDRVWDGSLAVRCWRDLDNPTGAAADTAMKDRATAQLDRALLRGMALILRGRVKQLGCSSSWATAQILGPVLDREATARDAAKAKVLRDELAKTDPGQVDVAAVTAAIDALFPCP